MSAEQQLEQQLSELGQVMTPDTDFTSGVMERIENSSIAAATNAVDSTKATSFRSRSGTLLAIVILAGLMSWLWQTSDQSDVAGSDWWLGSPSVYAGEIAGELQQALVEGVVFRSVTTYVLEDGSEETARKVSTIAVVNDRYRYESTTEGRLGMVTWSVPDNDEYVVTKYLAHDNSTRVRRLPHDQGLGASPLARVLEISRLIDQASQQMGPMDIDGHECVGFEINASKVHTKHKTGIYQVWIDVSSKRPVKVTFNRERRVQGDRNIKRSITIMDRFEWNPNLSDDTFEPHQDPRPLR